MNNINNNNLHQHQHQQVTLTSKLLNALRDFAETNSFPRSASSDALTSFQLQSRSKIHKSTFLGKFFDAFEKFNLPQVNSTDSLSSMASCNSMSSLASNGSSEFLNQQDISELSLPKKFFRAVEDVTIQSQPMSKYKPCTLLERSSSSSSLFGKIFIAFETFVDSGDAHEYADENNFPKLC